MARRATAVAAASEQASTNVQTVAAAAEELSKSIAEISHQVQGSTAIANTAVDEARRTDGRVQALTETAQKIGPVTVDMGGTACKVPSAAEYIGKVEKRGAIGKKRKSAKC